MAVRVVCRRVVGLVVVCEHDGLGAVTLHLNDVGGIIAHVQAREIGHLNP